MTSRSGRSSRPIARAVTSRPRPSGGYVMTAFDRLLAGGESEQAAVVPGKPDESHLIDQITPDDGKAEMPQGQAAADARPRSSWSAAGSPQGAVDDTPDERPAAVRHGAPAGLHPAAGDHRARLLARRLSCWPSPGSTRSCSGRPTAPSWSPGWSACPSGSSRSGSRPTARGWPSPAACPAGWARSRSGTSPSGSSTLSVPVTFDTVYGASWSPDGTKIAFGCADNTRPRHRRQDRRAGPVHGARTPTGCSTPSSRPTARTWSRSAAT